MVTGLFLGVKSGRGVTLTPHLLLLPWPWKCRAIPLLLLWAVQPVQSISACTRVTFTFSFVLAGYLKVFNKKRKHKKKIINLIHNYWYPVKMPDMLLIQPCVILSRFLFHPLLLILKCISTNKYCRGNHFIFQLTHTNCKILRLLK